MEREKAVVDASVIAKWFLNEAGIINNVETVIMSEDCVFLAKEMSF